MTAEIEKPSTARTIGPVTVSTTTAVAVTTLACWILNQYGIDPPSEVQGAITALLVFLSGWVIPSKRGKRSL